MRLDKNAFAFSSLTLASRLMNTTFYFYYVKLFLDKYHVSEPWFQFSQVVYMIWNALNDPLFAYFQEKSSWDFCRNRQKAIYYGAPLWVLSYLLPWFPWTNYESDPGSWISGMHLMISLFAYDALYTFVLLSQCALFAEMSVKHEDRLRLIKYNQVASVLGNCSIFITGVVSNNMENLFNLQLCCIFIAAISWLFIRYCALNTTTLYDNHIPPKKQKDSSGSENGYKIKNHDDEMSFKGACQITWQILCNKNFLSFVIMNFFQVLHQTFGTNFLLIFADHLIPKYALSSFERSFIYGASFILPQVVIILSGSIIEKYGSFRIIMATFYAQIFFAIAQYFIGRNHYYFVALYLVLETTLPSIAANFTSINIADVIDEDMAIHNLKLPRSSMIFGTNALVTKPAISLAPMIVVFILNRYGYDSLKESGIIKEEFLSKDAIQPDTIAIDQLHSVMLNFMCYFPIVLSIIQIFVWNRFQLRSSHKKDAKYADNGELY